MANRREIGLTRLKQTSIKESNLKVVNDYLYHIVDEGTLGASKHVTLVQELFLFICQEVDEENSWLLLSILKNFINETRGQEAPVIANSILWLLRELEDKSDETVKNALEKRINDWNKNAKRRLSNLTEYGNTILHSSTSIILFDYSSTVEAVITNLCVNKKTLPEIIVFESRVINGGWPYVQHLIERNIPVRYVLDSAMELECSRADTILLGVENLRCDGSMTNTIGSLPISKIGNLKGVKVYGCCDFFKLDLNSYKGVFKKPVIKNYADLLLGNKKNSIGKTLGDKRKLIDTACPELEVVPPQLLSGFITDIGLIDPLDIKEKGLEYFPEAQKYSYE